MKRGKPKNKKKMLKSERSQLKSPITAEAQKYGEGYVISQEELAILAIGGTEEECKANFQEEFFVLVNMYSVPDEGLRVGEMLRRRELTALIKQ